MIVEIISISSLSLIIEQKRYSTDPEVFRETGKLFKYLKYWNGEQYAFVLKKGQLQLSTCASSDDIRFTGIIEAK